jgi:protein phosphatase
MIIEIPSFSLVCLVGISGSGKSSFARRHFLDTEIVSSDAFRAMIADDESDQSVSRDAFDCLYYLAKKRLKRQRLTVVDATSASRRSRRDLLRRLANPLNCKAIAIVLDPPLAVCLELNAKRPGRISPEWVVKSQSDQLAKSLPNISQEGFHGIFRLSSLEEIAAAEIVRIP